MDVRRIALELWNVQGLRRRGRRIVIRHEQQLPVVLRAVALGAQEEAGLEVMQQVSIGEEESNDARLVLAAIFEIDAELLGRAEHAVADVGDRPRCCRRQRATPWRG